MHRLSAFLILILSLTLALLATSCGGSSAGSTTVTQSEQGVAVNISPTSASLACSSSQQFTATVTGGSNAAVTWTVDSILGGNSTVGTVSATGLYKAPASSGTHRVAAVSVADATKSATAVVTIACAPPPTVSISIAPKSANLLVSQQQQFTATVTGTSNLAVNWSVDGVAGGNSSTGTVSATGLYTAPSQAGKHNVTATSVADSTKSATAAVTVTAPISGLGVFTQRYDNGRTGLNPNESILTPANVNVNTFGLLHFYATDGMVYGQPLYVPNLNIPGEGTHNVIFVVTENDSIYAFDADLNDAEPLWQRSFLGQNVVPVPQGDVGSTIFPVIGITCTPVIDPSTSTIYFVVYTKEGPDNNATYVQRLHALDLATGQEKFGGPVVIQGQVNGTGDPNDGQGHVIFEAKTQLQRSAMLLMNGVIYIAESSHGDHTPYHGWIFGYDAKTLQQVSIYNSTPDGKSGSVWQAGTGLAADSFGNIYAITANGDFGGRQFSDSFIKLGAQNLSLFDFFTPFNEASLAANDNDLGSGGIMLIPGTRIGVGAGKEGSIYLVNLDNMGQFNPNQNNNLQFLPNAIGTQFTDNNFSTPAFFNGWVYFIGENDSVRQFQLINGLLTTTPFAISQNVFNHQGAQP